MSVFVAGLDLGQQQDYSALVIIEARGTSQAITTDEPMPKTIRFEALPLSQCDVGHVERFKLGTPYQQIANMMADRCARLRAPRYLAVDRTGVGAPAVEMMAALSPVAITIVPGARVARITDQSYHVPKRDLVAVSQIVLQNHILRIGKTVPHAELLFREMQNFRQKISLRGHDTYEAWREADHDDLVLALAIAIWTAQMIISIEALDIIQRHTTRYVESQISPY